MSETSVRRVGITSFNPYEDRMVNKRFMNGPDMLKIKDRHERALMIALLRQIAKGNQVPARLVKEVNEYFGYEVVPTQYSDENAAPAKTQNGTNPTEPSQKQVPAKSEPQQPEYTSISEMRARFTAADGKNKDGKIDLEEFTSYYIRLHENANKRFTNPNDPELAKLAKEAENIFNTLAEDAEIAPGFLKATAKVITRKRFLKIVNYYDSASDNKKDGKIELKYLLEDLKKFAKEGKDAKISEGKTLADFIA